MIIVRLDSTVEQDVPSEGYSTTQQLGDRLSSSKDRTLTTFFGKIIWLYPMGLLEFKVT